MSFDVARCISLHNTIVPRAIAQLPEDLQPTIIRNWFTAYNINASNPDLPVQLTEPLKEFLSGIDVVSAIDSSELWSHWFRNCSDKHTKCRKAGYKVHPFTPHRLIERSADCGEESLTWRLVCSTGIVDVQYLTLSHCWGSVPHTSLTKETYPTFLQHNKVSRLPKTFQHAISITFQLGFRYIWIDSLCIKQDDLEDWNAQASVMGKIYKGACCNIAATWARNGDEGCFAMKDSRTVTLAIEPARVQNITWSRRTSTMRTFWRHLSIHEDGSLRSGT